MYRYAKDEKKLAIEQAILLDALHQSNMEDHEGEELIIISEIISSTEMYIDDIPCLEYIIYNEQEDLFFARVWNTLTDQWDEALETQLNEKERLRWREKFL